MDFDFVAFERRIQALEMRCYRRLLGISCKDHISNKDAAHRIEPASGHCESLLSRVKWRKLKWFGRVTRREGLAKTVLQGTVRGGRKRGRLMKRWEDNTGITEWTRLKFPEAFRRLKNREEWRDLVYNSTSVVPGHGDGIDDDDKVSYTQSRLIC